MLTDSALGARALAHALTPFLRVGRHGRTVGSALDHLISAGPRYAWRRLRTGRAFAALGHEGRDALYGRIWAEAAAATGADLEELAPGLFELRRGGAKTRTYHQVTALDDPVSLRVALDKTLANRLLIEAGLTVTEHVEFDFRDIGPALDFLRRVGGPCVVKPASGTAGGGGTTGAVALPDELARARLRAARLSRRLLIERQLPGLVYRLLFLDGKLIDVVRNRPPRVTGDGRSTIEHLVAAENDRRLAARGDLGVSRLRLNLDAVFTLRRQGLAPWSVPPRGTNVTVQTVSNDNRVEDAETVHDPNWPDLVADAAAAVAATGLRLAGVDVITPDPAKPLAESGGALLEVNGTPGLHHHYLVADRAGATRVAVPILETLLR